MLGELLALAVEPLQIVIMVAELMLRENTLHNRIILIPEE